MAGEADYVTRVRDANLPAPVAGRVPVDATGSVAVTGEIEIKNDAGSPIPVSGPATPTDVQAVRDRLPAALDADGGVKIHVQSTPSVDVTDRDARLLGRAKVLDTAGAAMTPAKEATLLSAEAKLQTIIDQTDTLETRLTEVRDFLDTVETKLQTLINQTDALEADLASVKTQTEPANDYKEILVDLGTSRTDVALLGGTFTILSVEVVYHDGASSAFSGTPIEIETRYLRIGTNTKDKVMLKALTSPDAEMLFVGRVSGDLYLTNDVQTNKRLVLRVGIRV